MKSILHGTALFLVLTAALTGCSSSFKSATDKWGWTDKAPTGLPAPGTPVAPVKTPAQLQAEAIAAAKAKRDAAPTLAPGVISSNRSSTELPPPPAASQTPEFKLPVETKSN
jgi:hypothetical protein